MKTILVIMCLLIPVGVKAQINILLNFTKRQIIEDNKGNSALKFGKQGIDNGKYYISYLTDLGQVNYFFITPKGKCIAQVISYPIDRTPFIISRLNQELDAIGTDRWIATDRSFKCTLTLYKEAQLMRLVYRNIGDLVD